MMPEPLHPHMHAGMRLELLAYEHDKQNGARLTDWDIEFLENIAERIFDLTDKQAMVLEKIWDKCCGSE